MHYIRQPLFKLNFPTTKVTYKLPDILSAKEVEHIIKSVSNIKYRTLLMVIYGAGLRVSEAVNLRLTDIDSDRMTLHIHCGKGGKDRYVPLSPVVYQTLCQYWKVCRFSDFVFPGRNSTHLYQLIVFSKYLKQQSKKQESLNQVVFMGLRHGFATHLLESGTDIFAIKTLLGHASIQSTVRYLDFVPDRHQNLILPIEQLTL